MRYNNKAREKCVCARSSADRVPGYEPVGHRFKSCRARHIGASFISLASISFWKSEQAHGAAPPFPQKVTLRSAVRLQTRSQRFAIATNFLRFRRAAAHLMVKGKRKHHLEVSSNKTVCKNKLKAENQMLWVGKMNMCKARSDEIVKLEFIYD